MIHYHNITEWHKDFNSAWVMMLELLITKGQPVCPRPDSSLGKTYEVLNASFAIPSTMPLLTVEARKLSYAFAMLEPFFLFTNQEDTDIATPLTTYAPNLVKLSYDEKTGELVGNYGDRINMMHAPSQLLRCYKLLKRDPASRRAIITIHNPVFDLIETDQKDVPCTLNLQFLIREKKLHCFCNMRSNDIWYGTPHNVMMFTFLQRAMAGWLGVEPGDYVHRANSLHLYDTFLQKAVDIVKSDAKLNDQQPRVTYPTHYHPDVTFGRAQSMFAMERAIRTDCEAEALDEFPIDTYENSVLEHIRAFFAGKQK